MGITLFSHTPWLCWPGMWKGFRSFTARHGHHYRHPQSRGPPDEPAGGAGRQLLGKLEPKQVEAVSIEIAKMGTICGEEQEAVIQEFANANPTGLERQEPAGLEVAKNLVEQALGKAAAATLDNVRQSIEALPFGFLQKVDSQNLLTFIIDEHPQTIALILCHLPPRQAAEIIGGLPPSGRCRSSAASPRWARPARRSSTRWKRAWSTACRA